QLGGFLVVRGLLVLEMREVDAERGAGRLRNHLDISLHRPAVRTEGGDGALDPHVVAVALHAPVLELEPPGLRDVVELARRLPFPSVGVAIEDPPVLAEDLVALVAEDVFGAGVPAGDQAAVIGADDADVRQLIHDPCGSAIDGGLARHFLLRTRRLFDDIDQKLRITALRADANRVDGERAVLAALVHDALLDAIGIELAGEQLPHHRRLLLRIFGMREAVERDARELFARVTDQRAEPLVDVEPVPVGGGERKPDWRSIETGAQTLIAIAARRSPSLLSHKGHHGVDDRKLHAVRTIYCSGSASVRPSPHSEWSADASSALCSRQGTAASTAAARGRGRPRPTSVLQSGVRTSRPHFVLDRAPLPRRQRLADEGVRAPPRSRVECGRLVRTLFSQSTRVGCGRLVRTLFSQGTAASTAAARGRGRPRPASVLQSPHLVPGRAPLPRRQRLADEGVRAPPRSSRVRTLFPTGHRCLDGSGSRTR